MPGVAPTKPTLELLRSLSDEHVLRALMSQRQATRAEIAAATGLSKPTVSESVRRLSASGSVVDTGERTTGRGRVGTYYALPATAGRALVASLAPEGIAAEAVDVYGQVVARAVAPVTRSPGPGRWRGRSGTSPARWPTGRSGSPSSAPPIPWTGRAGGSSSCRTRPSCSASSTRRRCWPSWSRVPSPWTTTSTGRPAPSTLTGARPACATSSTCSSARASAARSLADGEVRRGHAGLAGEVAHLVTVGPDGTAMRLTDVFAALGLRRPGSTAIDVPALLRADAEVRDALARAVAGVLSAVVALTDPALVLVGGSWGRDPDVLAAVAREFADAPRSVPVEAGRGRRRAGARRGPRDRAPAAARRRRRRPARVG